MVFITVMAINDNVFLLSLFIGIIDAFLVACFAFKLKSFFIMRVSSFVLICFAFYGIWCLRETSIIIVCWVIAFIHLPTELISFKPPVWCSILLGVIVVVPLFYITNALIAILTNNI